MDQTTQLLVLVAAAAIGLVALFLITGRQRRDRAAATQESPYAVSTEGEKRCPKCGMGNLWTETRCSACKTPLRG
jgi:uncharacterized membrane protein